MKMVKEHRTKTSGTPSLKIMHVVMLIWVALVFIPILWIAFSALKTSSSILLDPWSWPIPPHWKNFANAWNSAGLGRGFLNSLAITTISIFTIVGTSALPAYVFRMKFKLNRFFYYFFVSGLMFPTFIAMTPLFLLMNRLGLLDNHFGLILVYTAYSMPFTVFILTAFFAALPKDLEEAAMIDGSGPFRVFFQIMLPLAKPGLVSAAIFNFVGIWNEYVIALILITDGKLKTLPVTLANLMMVMQYKTDFGALYAGIIMSIIPVIIVYLIFQKQLMSGTTSGAIKG